MQLYPQQRKMKNGHIRGSTAQAMVNAATSQAMIPLTSREGLEGRTSPPLRTYRGSMSHHRERNSNSSRKDNFARTDITFLIVFPMLFIIFNLCYWSSLYVWRFQNDDSVTSNVVTSNYEDSEYIPTSTKGTTIFE